MTMYHSLLRVEHTWPLDSGALDTAFCGLMLLSCTCSTRLEARPLLHVGILQSRICTIFKELKSALNLVQSTILNPRLTARLPCGLRMVVMKSFFHVLCVFVASEMYERRSLSQINWWKSIFVDECAQ